MMEQTLTPPPSFRVLHIRTRTRTRSISDENKCTILPPNANDDNSPMSTRSCKEKGSSISRGRTRSRVIRGGLSLSTSDRSRPHLSLTVPVCCSPPSSRNDLRSPGSDDDLIFYMSPVQPQSPSGVFFDSLNEVQTGARRVDANNQTLASLWEKHTASVTASVSQPISRTPCKRTRTGTVTQHQRGFSEVIATGLSPRSERRSQRNMQEYTKTLLDYTTPPHTPPKPSEPFMYSFPRFESSPLVKARQARARREACKAFTERPKLGLGLGRKDSGADDSMSAETVTSQTCHPGPIRARNLHIQSGESLCDDVDDANFISHAFRSASLDTEKDSAMKEDDDLEDYTDGYGSSQPSSSVSSSPTTDDTSYNILSSSLLASFPVRPASHPKTGSSSGSRPQSCRSSPDAGNETDANAMVIRGRSSLRTSMELQGPASEYLGGERRGRGRTPPMRRN